MKTKKSSASWLVRGLLLMVAMGTVAHASSGDADCRWRVFHWLAKAHGHCHHCGNGHGCRKVCRLVKDERKITTTCWGFQCEDFCLPEPGCLGCEQSECVCADCKKFQDKPVCARPQRLTWHHWIHGQCAEVHTKKKLMKRTVTKTIPCYKWVVEDLCASCRDACEPVDVPPDVKLPDPPKAPKDSAAAADSSAKQDAEKKDAEKKDEPATKSKKGTEASKEPFAKP